MKKTPVLIFLCFLLCSLGTTGHSIRLGLSLQTALGDIPYKSNRDYPASCLLHWTSDTTQSGPFAGKGRIVLSAGLNSVGVVEGTVAGAVDLYRYGPRAYEWWLGATYITGDDDRIESPLVGFTGLRYEEELTKGIFFTGYARFNMRGKYVAQDLRPELGLQLTWYFRNTEPPESLARLASLDVDAVLHGHMSVKPEELQEDRSEEIRSFNDLTKASSVQLPKFIKRGQRFVIAKEFSQKTEVIKVSAKIKGIPNRLFYLTKVSPTRWERSVKLPVNFPDEQVTVTLYIRTGEGISLEETGSTLVE